jgi:hypothetical protein
MSTAKSQFKKKENSLTEWISLPIPPMHPVFLWNCSNDSTAANSRNLSSNRPKFDVFRGCNRVSDPADRSKDRHFGCIPMIIPMISQFFAASIMFNHDQSQKFHGKNRKYLDPQKIPPWPWSWAIKPPLTHQDITIFSVRSS